MIRYWQEWANINKIETIQIFAHSSVQWFCEWCEHCIEEKEKKWYFLVLFSLPTLAHKENAIFHFFQLVSSFPSPYFLLTLSCSNEQYFSFSQLLLPFGLSLFSFIRFFFSLIFHEIEHECDALIPLLLLAWLSSPSTALNDSIHVPLFLNFPVDFYFIYFLFLTSIFVRSICRLVLHFLLKIVVYFCAEFTISICICFSNEMKQKEKIVISLMWYGGEKEYKKNERNNRATSCTGMES